MKISTQELESSQVLLEIEVDPPRVERAVDQAYRRFAQRLNVPGFRRGKAPRPIVERMVGREALLEEAIEQLVPQVYQEAVGEAGLTPIEQASVEVVETDPLRIKATVPVRPAVQLGEYRRIQRELTIPDVTEEQVQEVLDQLREEHATWAPVERAVQFGDRIAMDVHGAAGRRRWFPIVRTSSTSSRRTLHVRCPVSARSSSACRPGSRRNSRSRCPRTTRTRTWPARSLPSRSRCTGSKRSTSRTSTMRSPRRSGNSPPWPSCAKESRAS